MPKLSLRYFNDMVEKRLSSSSVEDLRNILRAMARQIHPSERQEFLDRLVFSEKEKGPAQKPAENQLMSEIRSLAESIRAAMADPHQRMEEYGWNHDYDEESEIYEEFLDPLEKLFDQAEAAFDYGDFALAREAYEALFTLCDQEDENGYGLNPRQMGVDFEEASERYLRAVYDTTPLSQRPGTLFASMYDMRYLLSGRPSFESLLQFQPDLPKDLEEFWPEWIAFLRERSEPEADALLREAVALWKGTAGLAELVQTEGMQRPKAYVDWLTALEEEERFLEEIAGAQAALEVLPEGLPVRAEVADRLCVAAEKTNNPEVMRTGRWEAFVAMPVLSRLVDLWEVTPQEDQKLLMRMALNFLLDKAASSAPSAPAPYYPNMASNQPVRVGTFVLVHARLLAENWQKALETASEEKVLGWSSSDRTQGLVLSFLLLLLSKQQAELLKGNLKMFWQQQLSFSSANWFSENNTLFNRLETIYAAVLPRISLEKDEETHTLSWCLHIAVQRVEAIVSGQHRGSYDKAAMLAAACAETLALRGEKAAAKAFLDDISARFPRHTAFQRELKAAMQRM